jgi:hypothetical protein
MNVERREERIMMKCVWGEGFVYKETNGEGRKCRTRVNGVEGIEEKKYFSISCLN